MSRYNVSIRWRFNNHWGISVVSTECTEGYVEVAILSFRNYNYGTWSEYNDHGFVDNNFAIARNFPMNLIPTLVDFLKSHLDESKDYLEIVNPEYGREIIKEYLLQRADDDRERFLYGHYSRLTKDV